MQSVLIVGAGKGGSAMLRMLMHSEMFLVKRIVDIREDAPGLKFATTLGIDTGVKWQDYLSDDLDIIIEATGSDEVFQAIRGAKGKKTVLVPGSVASIFARLVEKHEALISKLQQESHKRDLIFNNLHDGLIGIDSAGIINFYNKSAEKIVGVRKKEALHKHILETIPSSRLPNVLHSKRVEKNSELLLENGKRVISTRSPIIDEDGNVLGAFSVFKDITEVMNLAEEVTNLKEIQSMLESIIQSSDDAISVVDEFGRGLMINRAYSRLTGLKEEQVVGKPATADISEGESMHMKVLETRRAVRGVKMKVGPSKREVIVNVAPVIVDGKLKGSVGVIHDVSEIQNLTNELNRARQIIRTLEAKYSFDDIIGSSEEMRLAVEQAKLGARTPATVLLRGESGTGKELFAHAIHNGSERKYNKFIRVNCAAISETLLESELFGYEEGAFSGAKHGGKKGLFEEANNGSIFLDEIGELSANTQAKLLRVLQEGEIVRVGGTKPISINVRVIAATNVNLEKGIVEGTFREDLYYRLNRMPIHIPSLRKRKEDIPSLCNHLIQKINQDYGRTIEGLTEGAITYLMKYDWPGNVRELENILGRAIIFMNNHELYIDLSHIPDLNTKNEEDIKEETEMFIPENRNLTEMLESYEEGIIKKTLSKNNGNKTKTAKELGVSIRNLYYKMQKYEIE
ncbi:sigma-54 interaction domain-containing protein [Sutcliffiella cohnii]|uniref:Sigma-54-dependent Fis family transcriptional regulator n=1 Tax=Sutcliffiella cohnii TaxID=33932 RepID=A0A223KSW1_9BACI|nr:sigma-54-dependent Fis family transcriptional regulator [Sutcliffiella cohnii]AST92434.1 sigma-54-dependent Fis family transcriptional regulator [Sutcliffiella cohnii]MED4017095.1 sigma 54-interacting transcriptional regulator [Sutcliffiella cohnii]